MPYASSKQRGWAHTEAGTKALGGPDKVAEWDRASKGMDLPVYSKGVQRMAEGGFVKSPGGGGGDGDLGFPDLKAAFTARSAGSKSAGAMDTSFAKGGPSIGSRSIFMKTPDVFRTSTERTGYGGGKDPLADAEGDSKSEKPIKPRT